MPSDSHTPICQSQLPPRMGIDPNKLTVLEADVGDVIFADPPEACWDTVFVDIWPHLNDVWEDGWRWQALAGLAASRRHRSDLAGFPLRRSTAAVPEYGV